ncbi:MAG: class I SAM-dependent methyltransferase [Desulfomonile sp.]
MDYEEYITSISFRFVKPHFRIPIPEEYYDDRLAKLLKSGSPGWLEKIGVQLEFINTALPEGESALKNSLRDVCRIPKMSTLAIGAMINRAVSELSQAEMFVNVGVWHGFTFLCGMVNNPTKICVGVDNFSEFGAPRDLFLARYNDYKGPNHYFYEMDYTEYFSTVHGGSIGFYIYDGGHDYENQLKGLQIAEPFFSENCIILVDDTNWDAPRRATLDFISNSSSTYRILLDAKTNYNCHPTLWNGVLIFQRSPVAGDRKA